MAGRGYEVVQAEAAVCSGCGNLKMARASFTPLTRMLPLGSGLSSSSWSRLAAVSQGDVRALPLASLGPDSGPLLCFLTP